MFSLGILVITFLYASPHVFTFTAVLSLYLSSLLYNSNSCHFLTCSCLCNLCSSLCNLCSSNFLSSNSNHLSSNALLLALSSQSAFHFIAPISMYPAWTNFLRNLSSLILETFSLCSSVSSSMSQTFNQRI